MAISPSKHLEQFFESQQSTMDSFLVDSHPDIYYLSLNLGSLLPDEQNKQVKEISSQIQEVFKGHHVAHFIIVIQKYES